MIFLDFLQRKIESPIFHVFVLTSSRSMLFIVVVSFFRIVTTCVLRRSAIAT
jgi:hypothetical protein